jgi:hypothetical protein
MTLSVKDVETAIESYEDESGESGWYFWKYEVDHEAGVDVPGLGKVRIVEEVGGGEGSGEEMYLIFSVLPEGGYAWQRRYFQKNGYYASFDGANWDGAFVEVKPVKRTVTVFEEVRK